MIVRSTRTGVQLIAQPDHAALAGSLVRAWQADGLPQSPRRAEILLAVEQHDNGWEEVDRAIMIDDATGQILDFVTAPELVRQGVWPRGIERLSHTPYAAALVAQHALHIYRRHCDNTAWADFFTRIEAMRDQYLTAARNPDLGDLQRDYLFVRVADLASLAFCSGWTDPQPDDAGSDYVVQLDGSRLIITPDPFAGDELPISVPARVIPSASFRSAREAAHAFSAASRTCIDGVACGTR
jgi:uncharacterized protein DUF3891